MRRLELALNQAKLDEAKSMSAEVSGEPRSVISSLPAFTPASESSQTTVFFGSMAARLCADLKRERFKVFVAWLMPEGERYKSFRSLEKAVGF